MSEEAKARLGEDYRQLQRLLDKLEQGHVYVAAYGRVSVGKSALLNALAGKEIFATSVLHGKTRHSEHTLWQTIDSGGIYLIDTPGIGTVIGGASHAVAYGLIFESLGRATLQTLERGSDTFDSQHIMQHFEEQLKNDLETRAQSLVRLALNSREKSRQS